MMEPQMRKYLEPQARKYLGGLSPEDRKVLRKWQIGWCFIYFAFLLALFGVVHFLPGAANIEVAQSTSSGQHLQTVRLDGSK
jgi:hypothetical protein